MTEVLKSNAKSLARAAEILESGGLVILPTETVYGLAGLATNVDAVERIYRIKSRPKNKPLSAVVFSRVQAEKLGCFSTLARQLADAFWPGPLTLVLPLKAKAALSISGLGGGNTVGIRYPDIEWAEHFNKAGLDGPLYLPSANTSGFEAPTNAQSARDDIGDAVDLIIDAGPSKTGIESTIVSVDKDGAKLLRVGAIPPEELAPFPIKWAVA